MNKWVIDISHHNGMINFPKVKKAGIKAIIHKVLEGKSAIDAMFTANLPRMLAQGFYVGGYHFIRGTQGKEQADRFLQIVNDLQVIHKCEILPAIDAEDGQITLKELIRSSEDFATYIIEQTGKYPLFYINRSSVVSASKKG